MAGVEVRAVQRHIRMSPQKVRLVLDVVRGKNARDVEHQPHLLRRHADVALHGAHFDAGHA